MGPIKHSGWTKIWTDISHLIFPNICLVCSNELSIKEQHVCSFCNQNISVTNYHFFKEPTEMDKLFWGRVKVNATYAHLFFEKTKASQDILFNLKYKNNQNLGVYFGKEMAKNIRHIEAFKNASVYIPVPLHPKKKFIRGYNQSEAIAKGICNELEVEMKTELLTRTKHTETQTKKTRFQRWDNVSSVFRVNSAIKTHQHIVLVDDVITTGSTLESIIRLIQEEHPEILISVVTLAIA